MLTLMVMEESSCVLFFFYCKQKTAYEVRISDWSSDVCSSDLAIDCGRIHDDNFNRPAASQRQRGRAFSSRGRAGQADNGSTHWPRMKSLSSSPTFHCTQVGRPWLHWSAL